MSTRPQLVDVDAAADPPTMTIAFAGDGAATYVTVRLRARGADPVRVRAAAVAELRAFTARDLELLREIAAPGPPLPDPAPAVPVAGMLRPVTQRTTLLGPVFCPRCCRRLGDANDPTLGYRTRCPGCGRALEIRALEHNVIVVVRG